MATAYVLIDFENVQPKELGAFGGGGFKVMVFVGPAQPTVPVGLASALQALGHAGSYVHIEGRGPNALDMHIAYYIGRLAATDPGATFHIISRDRDYDPLIRHLDAQGMHCKRWKSVAEISAARAATPAPARAATPKAAPRAAQKPAAKTAAKPAPKVASSQIDEVVANLIKRGSALPSTSEKLASTIKSALANRITDKAALTLIEELKLRGLVVVKDGKVTYHLPAA